MIQKVYIFEPQRKKRLIGSRGGGGGRGLLTYIWHSTDVRAE